METFAPAVSAIGSTIARHPRFENGLKLLTRHLELAKAQRKAHLIVITGESGTGKSFILDVLKKDVLERKPPEKELLETKVLNEQATTFRLDDGLVVKASISRVPAKPTPKGLLEDGLRTYHVDDIARNTEGQFRHRLVTYINECETELFAIEEIQHITDQGSAKNCQHVDDLFKTIHDEIPCLMVLSGVCPGAEAVIAHNKQLVSRVRGYIRLPRFDWTTKTDREQFLRCLSTFRQEIEKAGRCLPDISSDDWAFRLYCTTGGILRLLANFLEEVMAISGDKEELQLADFANAYETFRFRPGLEHISFEPFGDDFLRLRKKAVLRQVALIKSGSSQITGPKANRRGRRKKSS